MTSPFEQLVATLDYPLYVVTTALEDERAGCLIGFATQGSIHPPRFIACISKKNRTCALARRASVLGVHILDKNDASIAELFGGETGDQVDTFARVIWHPGPSGIPVLDTCDRWFAGSVLEHIDLGDHIGFLLEPIEAERDAIEGQQLTFQRAHNIEPGHEP